MQGRKLFLMASCLTLSGLFMASCAPTVAPTPKAVAPSRVETPVGKPPEAPPPTKAPAAPPAPAAPASTPKPAAEQPRYGGSLALPTPSDPPNLDIHTTGTIALFAPMATIYNGIVQYDRNNKVVSDLAERWEVSPDGKVYTFHLRKGVKWHDGRPFTLADAKFSLDRIMANEALKFILEAVDKIEAPDENTLRITLGYRQAAFLALLAHGRALIAPKHVIEAKKDLKRDAIGTGPFKLKDYFSGVSFKMERNREYFVEGRPYLDGITFYIIKDMGARLASFRAGRLHIFGHPPTNTDLSRTHADTLKREMPQAVVRIYESKNVYGLLPNWTRAPWDDVRVRRAAFLAVDREAGLEVVSEGVGVVGISIFTGEWALPKEELMKMPGFRKPKDEDIAEAKRLLAEAGYPRGFKSSTLVRAGMPLYEKAATFMSDQLSKIGISLTLEIVEYAVFLDLRSRLNYDTMTVNHFPPLDDPEGSSRAISRKLGGLFISIDDDKILGLFDRQSRAATTEERKEILYELQRRVAEVVPHIVIACENSFIAFWPEVKNYPAQSRTHAHNKLEEIWLAK